MEFKELLNSYMKLLNCSAKTLAEVSDLSPTVLSRYRNGERVPGSDSKQLQKLSLGISVLAEQTGRTGLTQETVHSSFAEILNARKTNPRILADNLNMLISVLEINKAELSRFLNYDPSYLSRICSGQRTPANTDKFILDVCRFVVRRFSRDTDRIATAGLLGCEPEELSDDYVYQTRLTCWFGNRNIIPENADHINRFLKVLNNLDLEKYDAFCIDPSHFEERRAMPENTSHTYYGISEMEDAELEFLFTTIKEPSGESVCMCSDIPVTYAKENSMFRKEWLKLMCCLAGTERQLNVIHNLSLPFEEIMLLFEKWLPIYIMGQVNVYYLKEIPNNVYSNLNYVSGSTALSNESITGFLADGKAYLTTIPEEIRYYRRKAECLMTHAQPMMEIYREKQREGFIDFLEADSRTSGTRREYLSVPPAYVMEESFIRDILERNQVEASLAEEILLCSAKNQSRILSILSHGHLYTEVPILSEEEFRTKPMVLHVPGIFFKEPVYYTYEDYLQHIGQLDSFAALHPTFSCKKTTVHALRNVQITIHEGRWVLVSRNCPPTVHFVVRHPKLRIELENMVIPMNGK